MPPRITYLTLLVLILTGCITGGNPPAAVTPPTNGASPSPSVSIISTVVQSATKSPDTTETVSPYPTTVEINAISGPYQPPEPLAIFTDQLAENWQNWSWDTDNNLSNENPIQSGSKSMAVTFSKGWAGFYLHTDLSLEIGIYNELSFYIHGGTKGGQQVNLVLNNDSNNPIAVTADQNAWKLIVIPLSIFGSPAGINDIFWQDATGGAQPVFYIDQVALTASSPSPTATPLPGGLNLSVDANANQRPISPYIYGINFADETMIKELNPSVSRWGGNATTRYNWKADIHNRAADWFFENIPNDNSNPAALPDGSASDQFVDQNKQTGVASLLTLPMIGWTPKDRNVSCGFSVNKYGEQQYTDSYRPECGNGVRANGSLITGNDPTDTSIAIGPDFIQEWVQHLIKQFGTAGTGGVQFYNLDNEPYLWNINHRDVHPDPVSFDELRDLTYQYAAALKAIDPTAQTLGPAEWGWTAYFFSAKDAGDGSGFSHPIDKIQHGNTPLVEWYLQQMNAYEQQNGTRILDYLDLHYYPQGSNVALSSAVDPATQALRLRSTRALWDRSYKDESWIDEPVYLIPHMREWVDKNYPGTKLAITEYNWGALDHINGALAQATILGIFGREGLDLATLWALPGTTYPGAFAFRMYRNYDGKGSTFGDTSVLAESNHEDSVSIFGARRSSDGALTLLIVNKTNTAQITALSVANFNSAANVQVFQYSKANLDAIEQLPDTTLIAGKINLTLQADSITMVVLPIE